MKNNIKIAMTLTLSALILMSLYLFSFADPPGPPTPPTISGSPSTTATVGTAYSFIPSSTNATGFANTGTILPSWLTLNATTGALSGTPTTAGTTSNIIITASNAAGSASLSSFSITVATSGGSGGTGGTGGTKVPVMDGLWLLPGALAGIGLFARRRKQ